MKSLFYKLFLFGALELLVLSTALIPRQVLAADFRNVDWGMTSAEVREAEQVADLVAGDESILLYTVSLAGHKCSLTFKFEPEGVPSIQSVLRSVVVRSASTGFTDSGDQLPVFDDFCRNLSSKYGPPSVEKEIWAQKATAENRKTENWAFAIASGRLTREKHWDLETTLITCTIWGGDRGDQGRIHVELLYRDSSYSEPEEPEDLSGF